MERFPADDFSLPAGLTRSPGPESFALQEAPFFGKPLFQQGSGPRGAHGTHWCGGTPQGTPQGTSQGTRGATSLAAALHGPPHAV